MDLTDGSNICARQRFSICGDMATTNETTETIMVVDHRARQGSPNSTAEPWPLSP